MPEPKIGDRIAMTVAVNWDQHSVMSGAWGPSTSVHCDTAPFVIGNIFQTDWAADFSVAGTRAEELRAAGG